MPCVTFRGILTDHSFMRSDTEEYLRYAPCKGVIYPTGEVYALFEQIGNSYILISAIPVNSE